MYIVSAAQADRIRAYVQGGGTFIAGFRLGVKDEHSRIVDTPLPGLLRDVMGVELIDYQPIYSEKQAVEFKGPLAGRERGLSHLGGHSRSAKGGGAGYLYRQSVCRARPRSRRTHSAKERRFILARIWSLLTWGACC